MKHDFSQPISYEKHKGGKTGLHIENHETESKEQGSKSENSVHINTHGSEHELFHRPVFPGYDYSCD